MRRYLILLALLAGPALAESCPDPQDYSAELETLIDAARDAPDEPSGRVVSGKMWEVWRRAPDDKAQTLLDTGMRQREGFDFAGAHITFDALIAYCPAYAEGWNQRAFVRYLQGNWPGALTDLDETLKRTPQHVAAQAGRALTLMQMGQTDAARAQMLDAVRNNPWLSERALLAKGAPLGPVGEDI